MQRFKKIGIVGLGLIGGSLAKTIRNTLGDLCTVWGLAASDKTLSRAVEDGAIKGPLDDGSIPQCDLLIVALWPGNTIDWILRHADAIKPGAVVVDCCGVKRTVCRAVEETAREKGWYFIGGHPMAGREYSGYAASKGDLFHGAPMILTPGKDIPKEIIEAAEAFFLDIHFDRIRIATPEEHDRVIAYTSQLAHVVSSAYVKGPIALRHIGFSAGSLRDLTRVARLNEAMWTELFLHNGDALCHEIDGLVERLLEFRDAIYTGDGQTLNQLLREGREQKERMDNEKN